jgi:hypothetical protein
MDYDAEEPPSGTPNVYWTSGSLSFLSKIAEEKRSANSLEMPSKFAELVLPQEATKMQANLLPWGEDIVVHCEYFDACLILSIHTFLKL